MHDLKQLACAEIDANKKRIIEFGEKILCCPELGYKEHKTSKLVREEFERLGIEYEYPLAITGVKGVAAGKNNVVNVCIIGELDAVKSPLHKMADGETGACHACGHNAQVAQMMGCAIGLVQSDVIKQLDGTVTFFAVPAEEFIEIEYRLSLCDENKIECIGGKQELLCKGFFDDVDIAIMIHAQAEIQSATIFARGTSLGFVAKEVSFSGVEAHASMPWDGVNALNAAMLALSGIHANRETFKEADKIRIHPIITKGGDLVNTIPADVRLETYIRGANKSAIMGATEKVERCIRAGADMVGASAQIKTIQGYLPLLQDENLSKVFEENARYLHFDVEYGLDMVGSSDIGDLSHILPCIQPTMGGFAGAIHSKDFEITDKNLVYIEASKLLAMTVIDLLIDNAKQGLFIKENFIPKLSKTEYVQYIKHGG